MQFWLVFVLVVADLVCACVYYALENRRTLVVGTNTREDDTLSMKAVWAVVWLSSTVGFLPLTRTLLGAADCTGRGGGKYAARR